MGAAGSGAAGVAGCMPEVSAGRTWAAGKTVYLEDCKRKEKEKKRKEKKRKGTKRKKFGKGHSSCGLLVCREKPLFINSRKEAA